MYIYAYLIGALLLSHSMKISACAMDPNKLWHASTGLNSLWPSLVQPPYYVYIDEVSSYRQCIKKLDNVALKEQSSNSPARKGKR